MTGPMSAAQEHHLRGVVARLELLPATKNPQKTRRSQRLSAGRWRIPRRGSYTQTLMLGRL